MRIILASASPRRKVLLASIFNEFEIIPAQGEEAIAQAQPDAAVQALSFEKATQIEQQLQLSNGEYLIIGADTAVACHGQIFGKPQDEADAAAMLRKLSGNVHKVYTGVTVIGKKDGLRSCTTFAEATKVVFYPMDELEIQAYIQTGEPMDKAGSYGIQGIGGRFVEKIEGDYNNVIGLPVAKLYQVLKNNFHLQMF